MAIDTQRQEDSTVSNPTADSPRIWQKPEAKVAEVASATLASNHTHNTADLATCAS